MKLRTKIILGVVGIALTLYFRKCYKEYYEEYDLVKNDLEKIDGIKVLSIDGNPDLRFEVYSATILLKDIDTIKFLCQSDEKGLKDVQSFRIIKINNWGFNRIGCIQNKKVEDDEFNIGQNSDYETIRALNIKNTKDAVTDFEEVKFLLNKISTYPYFDTIVKNTDTLFFQKYNSSEITNPKPLKSIECR